jgi:hypothetical protein
VLAIEGLEINHVTARLGVVASFRYLPGRDGETGNTSG